MEKKFKSHCDQLATIGHSISDDDNSHWFLCGLGPAFETFSTCYRSVQSRPPYRDILAQVEGHEFFLTSLHGSSTPQTTFTASHHPSSRLPNQILLVDGVGLLIVVVEVVGDKIVEPLIICTTISVFRVKFTPSFSLRMSSK